MKCFALTVLLLSNAVYSGRAANETNLLVTSHFCSDQGLFFEIPTSKADHLPKWSPETGAPPPLTIAKACALAKRALAIRDPQLTDIQVISVQLRPVAKTGSWYYAVEGEGIRYDRHSSPCGYFAVILMDGSNVEPRVVPQTSDLSEAMRQASAHSFDYGGNMARAFSGSTNALALIFDFGRKIDPDASPGHGAILIELLGLFGDDLFSRTVATRSPETKASVLAHLVVGTKHTRIVKLQRPISDAFPVTFSTLAQK